MVDALAGRGFIIVGGTAGIGLAAATALAAAGADVAVVGRDARRAQATATGLGRDYGVRAVAVPGDAGAGQDEVDRFVSEATEALGDVAGMAVTTGTDRDNCRRPLDAMTDENWAAAFNDLVMATVRPCKAIVPHLLARGGGSIVTTAAHSVRAPDPTAIPYSTLKAAVATFTKGLARTYARQGVVASCICPGAIETEKLHAARAQIAASRGLPFGEALERVMKDDYGLDIAMGRLGRPEEVGELIAFLLSGRAPYLTGALINIDGGTNF